MACNDRVENEQVVKNLKNRKKKSVLGEKRYFKVGDTVSLSSLSFNFRHLLQDEQIDQNYYLTRGEKSS